MALFIWVSIDHSVSKYTYPLYCHQYQRGDIPLTLVLVILQNRLNKAVLQYMFLNSNNKGNYYPLKPHFH